MNLTSDQRQFLLFFAYNVIPLIKYNSSARNACRNTYSMYARRGQAVDGARKAIEDLCGECEFSDETIKPFIKAIVAHFQGGKHVRKKLTKEEQDALLIACGMKCQHCGKLLTDINFDHILPFCLVFETIENNRQCLCPECNRAKAANIPTSNVKRNQVDEISRVPA